MRATDILEDPEKASGTLRLKILELYHKAHAGHIGSSLSCVDMMMSVLFLNKNPNDTFILSKGHAAASLYVCLNVLGEIPDADLDQYYLDGTKLPAHPPAGIFAGIPFATGSLGHGLPIGAGMAHAAKLREEASFAYILMSDGETNEGTTWEAASYASANALDNVIVLIDKNKLQGFGTTQEVLGDTSSPDKWRAFGFEVAEANGHDILRLDEAIKILKMSKNGQPKVIIADTVKGKGVGYMENKLEWHYLPMTDELYHSAQAEIRNRYFKELANVE